MHQVPGKITLLYSLHKETHLFIRTVSHVLENHHVQFSMDKQSICQTFMQTIIDSFHIMTPIDLNTRAQDLPHYLQSLLEREANQRLNIHQDTTSSLELSSVEKNFTEERFINNKESSYNFDEILQEKKILHLQGSSIPLFATQPDDFYSNNEQSTKKERKLNKKKRFTKKIKDQISEYCKNYGVEEASLRYQVPVNKINHWNHILLKRGRKPIDIEMQDKLCEWIYQQLRKGKYITQKIFRQQAKKFSKLVDFKASKGWLEKLFRRRPQILQAYNRHKEYLKLEKANQKQNRDLNLQQSSICQCKEKLAFVDDEGPLEK